MFSRNGLQGHLPACIASHCSPWQNKKITQPASTYEHTPRWAHDIAEGAVTSLPSSNTTDHILDRRTTCMVQWRQEDDSLSCGKTNLTSIHKSPHILRKKTLSSSLVVVELSTSISWSVNQLHADNVNRLAYEVAADSRH